MKLPLFIRKADLFTVLVLAYAFWLFTLYRRQTGGMDDFDIFFKAGERLLRGENIYGPPHYYNLKYFYSVLFAGLLSLFQWTDINTVKFWWFFINTSLFIRVFYLLRQYIWPGSRLAAPVMFVLLLICGKMVLVNYTYNQISVLMLWTMTESFHQLQKGRIFPAVFILCLGINIKILPVVLVPYFLYIGKKPVLMTLAGISLLLLFLFLPAFFIGWDYNLMLAGEWWKTLNPVSEIHVMQTYEYGFTDLSSMVTKFLSAEPVYNEPALHVADLGMTQLFLITNFLRVFLLAAVVWLAFRLKKPVYGISREIIVSAAFMALIPLCFPHQREYSFIFSMPMLAILLTLISLRKRPLFYVVFILLTGLSGLLVWVDFAGQVLVDVFKHYRLITLGMTGFLLFYLWLGLDCARKQNAEAGSTSNT